MTKNNVETAVAYYTAVGEKNIDSIEQYLHPDVQFIGPMARLSGRKAVLDATRNFAAFFKTLKIRTKVGSDDQVVVVYDLDDRIPAAVLMSFQNGAIAKLELFYDARPFEKQRDEIF
jgi:ketosteroid isomerase-like protein